MYGVLIPSLNPDDKLIKLVMELKKYKIDYIFIENDGSPKKYDKYFNKCEQLGCIVFNQDKNYGKGRALKNGIENIIKKYPKVTGIVTADSDGQHTPHDIYNVLCLLKKENKVIIGTRNIRAKHVPIPSKIGNTFSTFYLKITTGIYLEDTQTGLRGIPKKYFDYALNVEGERFEYEMAFLEGMKENNILFTTTSIDTVYDDDRKTHFKFIKDSFIIYKSFFKNLIIAITSSIIDIVLFSIFNVNNFNAFTSSISARIISGIYNFTLNKVWAFEKKDSNKLFSESIKYLILFIVQMFITSTLVFIVDNIFKFKISIVIVKIIIDIIIFFVNFVLLKNWVFKAKKM